jgi:hypothetical protein
MQKEYSNMNEMLEEDVLRKMIKEAMMDVLKGDDMLPEEEMMDDQLPEDVEDFIEGEEAYELEDELEMEDMLEEDEMAEDEEDVVIIDIMPPKKKKSRKSYM